MRAISLFSTRYPKTIFLMVLGLTVFFIYQFRTNAFVEPDTSKFLPTDIAAVKANDYYQKNFSYNESLIVGIEAPETGIMNPDVLHSIEKMVDDVKELKVTKTFNSKLTGNVETVVLPIGIDAEDVLSVSNLEDAILDKETGAVVTGSVIEKLKKEQGVAFTDETAERLPESAENVQKIIPALRTHILNNRLFKGNILSADEKATAISIPMINKWEYKQRYAQLELETALDPLLLKQRYQGATSVFPFTVYGKTIDGVTYNDQFIEAHSKNVQKNLRKYLDKQLSPAFDEYPELKELMSNDLTSANFSRIMQITQAKEFFMHKDLKTWDKFITGLYDVALNNIDPLSYENLEFQLPDVKQVYDLLDIYDRTLVILDEHKTDGLNTYVAGQPVVISVMSRIINRDMGLLMPFGVIMIFLMLAIGFRSVKGVVIPMITVVLSVIWALGFMAFTGTPITTSTSIVPIILLAVGSAYGIHFLNRYNEDASLNLERRETLRRSIRGVGVAIIMAGITTFCGFLSLASSKMLMIRHFSLFTAFGIAVALLLTLTLTPAILCYWKRPSAKTKPETKKRKSTRPNILDSTLIRWATMVRNVPGRVVTVFVIVAIGSGYLMKDLKFEGGMISEFGLDNPLRQSDMFINRYLTGTGQINLLFKFRETVNLENEWVQEQLAERSGIFSLSWEEMVREETRLQDSQLQSFKTRFMELTKNPLSNESELNRSIALLNDAFNEEYVVEVEEQVKGSSEVEDANLNALFEEDGTLGESDGMDSLDGLGDLAEMEGTSESAEMSGPFSDFSAEQVAGLKDINQRLGLEEDQWETTGRAILALREAKATTMGESVIHDWRYLQDLFATDIKQPYVLHKLENLREQIIQMKAPQVEINGELVDPTGFVSGPVDLIRSTYSVFYHDEDPAFKKIPDTRVDNLGDSTLTDRNIIGVVLNQAQNSSRDTFEGIISPDLKEFQMNLMVRNTLTTFSDPYIEGMDQIVTRIFPENDPYIADISVGGQVPVNMEIMLMIADSQVSSILQAMVFVFIVTFFIFRSPVGGLYSLIPLAFTIIANFGTIMLLGWKINTGTMMVASISIGIGVDYTIHFLERFKAQLQAGDAFNQAYFNTIKSVGKAILINAVSVAAGFLVLLASELGGTQSMGVLMFGTMFYSSVAALTLLPAVIFITKPKFLSKVVEDEKQLQPALEN